MILPSTRYAGSKRRIVSWIWDPRDRRTLGEQVARKLEDFYRKEGIQPHCRGQELIDFCSRKDGVRGIFLFDKIVEMPYKSRKDWFRRGDFQRLFGGAQPYAQGFPFRYLYRRSIEAI